LRKANKTNQQWHLSRLQNHSYSRKLKFDNQKKKPYVCKFCKWRTDSLEKINKHIEKFDAIFIELSKQVNRSISNPHKAIHLSYALNDDKELMSHWRHDLRLNKVGVICKSCEIVLERS